MRGKSARGSYFEETKLACLSFFASFSTTMRFESLTEIARGLEAEKSVVLLLTLEKKVR